MDLLTPSLKNLLDLWLNEDIGRGDLTSITLNKSNASAHWVAKEKGIFCGGFIIKHLFERVDGSTDIDLLIKDGESFLPDQKILKLKGNASSLVAGERTALNIAMHLSGISTATAALVAELNGTDVQLADTRKTTPGLRILEKYAVRCGGGINHRLGLDDAAMLKENHLAWTKDISTAINSIRMSAPWTTKVIVEAETTEQAKEAVLAGADAILLDEFSPEELHKIVPQLRELAKKASSHNGSGQIILEASGVNPNYLKAYAATGIDLISSSMSITKSSWVDFSMRFDELH